MIEGQRKKQIKAIEEHGKQLVKSNAIISGNDFNIDRDNVSLEKQKEIFHELLKERASELNGMDDKINPNNLVCKFKNENSLEDF